MVLQLTLSCDLNQSQTGPTLIHSTGVQHYRIPPEVIRILQETITNDYLSDDEQGVLCKVGPQTVLKALRQNGFTLQKQTTDTNRALWTLVQSGGSDTHVNPVVPTPAHDAGQDNDEEKKDEEGEAAEDEKHHKDEEEEEEEEPEGGEEEEEEEES